ncbi:MAG TPA: hypothetical protein VK716_08175 [Terracidiphilus sp.]|jgi:hypothetical protein|nr:hypothetical protein [Terracidiphilus sp.]
MSDNFHEPAYRAALDSAFAELDQISQRLTELRANKQVLETAIDALRPMFDSISQVPATQQAPIPAVQASVFEISSKSHPIASEPVVPTYRRDPHPAPVGSSLEDQINHALGLAALA